MHALGWLVSGSFAGCASLLKFLTLDSKSQPSPGLVLTWGQAGTEGSGGTAFRPLEGFLTRAQGSLLLPRQQDTPPPPPPQGVPQTEVSSWAHTLDI